MTDPLTSTESDLKKLATGTTMAFFGSVCGNALVYLYGLVIGRFLGAEILGLYFLALVFVQLISSVCRMGLSDGLLRFVAIHVGKGDSSRAKGSVLSAISVAAVTSGIAAVILFQFAEPISNHLLRQPDLASFLRWFAAALPFLTVFMLTTSTTQALKRMDLVVLSRDFLQPAAMFLLGAVFFYFMFMQGANNFLAGYLGSMVVALGASVYFLTRAYPVLAGTTSAIFEWKVLLAFSLPIALGDLAHYLFRWSDTFLLSFFTTPSEVGVYNAALRTTLLLGLISVSANALYAPIIANHHHQGRHQELQMILKTLLRWCLTLALPIVFTIVVVSEDILSLWGPEFVVATTPLTILAASQLISISSNLLAFTLLMCGRQYFEVGNIVFATILNIGMNLVLIPHYGVTGAAISRLASQGIAFLTRLVEVRVLLDLHLYTSKYLKPIVALIPVTLLILTIQNSLPEIASFPALGSNVVAMVVMFSMIAMSYFLALYLLGFEKEDLLIWRGLQVREMLEDGGRVN